MKIITFYVYQLTNGAHFAFIQAIIKRARAIEAIVANCTQELETLEAAFQVEDNILLRHKKNLLTDTLAKADAQRDRLYSLLRSIAKGSRDLENSPIAEAANVVYQIIKAYGWISTFKYDRQTGMLYNLCQDLQGTYAAEVETLGLTQMVANLKAANDNFAQIMADRTDTVAGQIKGEMAAARKDTDNAYYDFVEVVNSLSILAQKRLDENPYQAFVEYVNAEIDRLKRTELSQRVSNNTAEPTEPDEPGFDDPNDGDDPDYPTNPDEDPEENEPENPENPNNPDSGNTGNEGENTGNGNNGGSDNDNEEEDDEDTGFRPPIFGKKQSFSAK